MEYVFSKASSSKCAYCTLQNEKCRPVCCCYPWLLVLILTFSQVPTYVKAEYDAFRGDLVAWETLVENDEGDGDLGELEATAAEAVRAAAWGDLRRSAHVLASVVQVATAQLKETSAADVLLHQYHVQPVTDLAASQAIRDLADEVRTLREEVGELRQVVVSLPVTSARLTVATRRDSRQASNKATADLDAPMADVDEELSDVGEAPA